ncbi:MAG: hypothetical protein EBV77_07250 [Gemmatimonadaceae bacterium]|nr:hypothetical protein [Gemmatimonadaceae bacterium]
MVGVERKRLPDAQPVRLVIGHQLGRDAVHGDIGIAHERQGMIERVIDGEGNTAAGHHESASVHEAMLPRWRTVG